VKDSTSQRPWACEMLQALKTTTTSAVTHDGLVRGRKDDLTNTTPSELPFIQADQWSRAMNRFARELALHRGRPVVSNDRRGRSPPSLVSKYHSVGLEDRGE